MIDNIKDWLHPHHHYLEIYCWHSASLQPLHPNFAPHQVALKLEKKIEAVVVLIMTAEGGLSLSRISRLNLDPDSIWIWTYSITGQQVTCTHRILIRCTLILISWVLLLSFFDYWKLNLWQNSAGTPEGIKTLIENSVLNLQINNSFIQIDRLKHFDVLIIICLHSTTIEISSVYHKALTIILTEDTN
jgi:hypothetical protein